MKTDPVYHPDEKEYLNLTRQGNLIPVYREILGDRETPVSAYFKIAQTSSYAFLLESVEGQEKLARYSFLARDPEVILKSKNQLVEIIHLKKGKVVQKMTRLTESPWNFIRTLISPYKFVKIPGLPRFCGGLVGYIGYDMIRFLERLPDQPKDDLQLPDMCLVLAQSLMIFDHLNHTIKVVSLCKIKAKDSIKGKKKTYQQAIKDINQLIQDLQKPLNEHIQSKQKPLDPKSIVRSNLSKKEFLKIILSAKNEIKAGEIIQTVLSQRFEVPMTTDPFHIYRTLRALNPSPYMYYLNFNELKIIGASPEMLIRCEDGLVNTRPIAGTRKRGKDDKEDEQLMKDLLKDPKEKAEHVMLVDLGRNDLGRVCQKGTVKVTEFMTIEKYSNVIHIVSNVSGKLKAGCDSLDALQAAFPAGTVSGAPKIRAMEIIDELENVSRGPYAGCIGYFSFSGNLDTCITIRSIVVKGDKAYIQAGAGIVADSQPRREYTETVNKAKSQILAIRWAHQQSW